MQSQCTKVKDHIGCAYRGLVFLVVSSQTTILLFCFLHYFINLSERLICTRTVKAVTLNVGVKLHGNLPAKYYISAISGQELIICLKTESSSNNTL